MQDHGTVGQKPGTEPYEEPSGQHSHHNEPIVVINALMIVMLRLAIVQVR